MRMTLLTGLLPAASGSHRHHLHVAIHCLAERFSTTATRKACSVRARPAASRRTTENAGVTDVRERLSDPASIHYLLQRVESEVERLHAHLPGEMALKRAALASEERRIANYIDFIGEGKGTRALGEALTAAEQKAASFRAELQSYEASAQSLFKAPPVEWVAERLSAVKQVLEAEPTTSALTLRRVLGPVRLFPVAPQVGRSYYKAEPALQVLDLIEAPEDGSNWLRWWRRWELNPRPETLSLRRLRR